MRFHATILLSGKTATGVRVPPAIVEGLGSSKRPMVQVTINDYRYRSSVAMMHGEFMLPISAEVRDRAGIAAGDEVDVELELDTQPREVIAPPDFKDALARDVDATRCFGRLSYSNQRRVLIPIEAAKATETRQRRIARAIGMLREGRIQIQGGS
ncbi:MAG TPA: YdeI/OmpD-associated family protein [Chloroflexota bacterium]|nr:YdeI/OmpD-associated family protein [Chloroflexota bacterium]